MRLEAYNTRLEKRTWLSDRTFEIELSKPEGFNFIPGQRIHLFHEDLGKEFPIISTPDESVISLCVKYNEEGIFSQLLGNVRMETPLRFKGPMGYFSFHKSERPAVFAATGTGVAPFVSMARSGIRDFILLHGVRIPGHLYYGEYLKSVASTYVPCISDIWEKFPKCEECFHGQVTDYILRRLPPKAYDFYLCGRASMIRDVTRLVDDHFPGSRVYMDTLY